MAEKPEPFRIFSALAASARRLADELILPRRRRVERALVKESYLFDADWYLQAYPDVAQARVDPLHHFMEIGWREGRDPGPEFGTTGYLKANADVARSGMNPLLHFIEFGQSEGRATVGSRPALQAKQATFSFGSATQCASFQLPDQPSIRWRRAYRLDPQHANAVMGGEFVAGYASNRRAAAEFRTSMALLSAVSGYGKVRNGEALSELPSRVARLSDAWFVNSAQLRTRWTSEDYPFVVRAFQTDPLLDGNISMVGEGLICSPTDVIDLHLKNPFFPLLFMLAEPTGLLRGSCLLPFPSLCRGGTHYPELIFSAARRGSATSVDPIAEGQDLMMELMHLVSSKGRAAVGGIVADLRDALGSEPLFRTDFKKWLEKVVRIGVEGRPPKDTSDSEQCLVESVRLDVAASVRAGGASLVIAPNMVPTIAVLTAQFEEDGAMADRMTVPLIIAGAEPSQPATLVEPPLHHTLPSKIQDETTYPYLEGTRESHVSDFSSRKAGAIRLSSPRCTDAELLVPIATPLGATSERPAITWLVEAPDGNDSHLAETIQALGLQQGNRADALFILGSVEQAILARARGAFPGGVKLFAKGVEAAGNIETPLVGFVGVNVLLHDSRSAGLLSSLLENDEIFTASCALVKVDRRGRAWHAAVAEAGAMATAGADGLPPADGRRIAEQLWRTNTQVAAPPRDLWIARATSVLDWIRDNGAAEPAKGIHLCTSLVTASYVGERANAQPWVSIPKAPADQATRVELLFG